MSTNILDTFIIAFQGDASGVKAEAEQGRAAAAEMANEIDRAGASALQAGEDIKGFLTALAGTGAAALATFSAAVAGLVAAQDKMAATDDFAASIGAQASDVAALEEMTARAGGSVEKTRAALAKLSEDGGDAIKNLGDVAKAMEKLPKAGQIALGEKLGLDRDVIAELSKGFAHYSQMVAASKANMPYTERDFTAAREVSHLWNQVKAGMEGMPAPLTLLSVKLSGMLKEVLTLWRDFQQSPMSEGMVKAIGVAAVGLENMWKMIKLVGAGLAWVYDKLRGFLPVIAGIGGALLVALLPLQTLGFGAIIAGIALLLLALDDLRVYFQGGRSLFGTFLKDHPKVAAFLKEMGGLFSKLGDAAGAAWDVFKEKGAELWAQFQKLLPTTDDLSDGIGKVTSFLEENKDTIIKLAKAGATLLAMWLAYKAKAMLSEATDGGTLGYLIKMIGIIGLLTVAWHKMAAVIAKVAELWKSVKEAGGAFMEKLGLGDLIGQKEEQKPGAEAGQPGEIIPGAAAAAAHIQAANASPLNGVNSTAAILSNANTNTTRNATANIGKVEVHTQATDADGVARDFNAAMERHIRAASDHLDDGVSH